MKKETKRLFAICILISIFLIGILYVCNGFLSLNNSIIGSLEEQNELITQGYKETFYDEYTHVTVTHRPSGVYTNKETKDNLEYVLAKINREAPKSEIVKNSFVYSVYINANESSWNHWYIYEKNENISLSDCVFPFGEQFGLAMEFYYII